MESHLDSASSPAVFTYSQETIQPFVVEAEMMFSRWARRRSGVRRTSWYSVSKRVFDFVVVVFALAVLAPVLALVAIAIKVDSRGPVFFAHDRMGRDSKSFKMFKFRTMAVGSETRREELAALNELKWPEFKITKDPRVTRIGKFLRKTSLDELPQLFNILRGEMSLVGPRPSSVDLSKYEPFWLRRLEVPPGLTGPAQLWKRNADFQVKCLYDLEYLKYRSFLLDLYLILMTARLAVMAPNGK